MNNALKQFIKDIYLSKIEPVIDYNYIKKIENLYKNKRKEVKDYNEFLKLDPQLSIQIKKVPAINCDLKRQLEIGKGLQAGSIVEDVLAQTLAKKYGLNKFVDLFHTYIREIPANVIKFMRQDENEFLCKYLYYNPDNINTFLIQYGNPTSYDADLFINGELIKIEFKDKFARAGEKDVPFYSEEGKLEVDDKFIDENADYLPIIKKFNEKNDIISIRGSNYKIESDSESKTIFKSYIRRLNIDALVSFDKNNDIIAVTRDCIDSDELEILSYKTSEIRSAGKNAKKVFTPNYLLKSIKEIDGIVMDELVRVSKENMTDRIDTTNNRISGKQINSQFYVEIEKVSEDENQYLFTIEDVKQLKPTISAHIQVIVTKEQLKEYYKDILNS